MEQGRFYSCSYEVRIRLRLTQLAGWWRYYATYYGVHGMQWHSSNFIWQFYYGKARDSETPWWDRASCLPPDSLVDHLSPMITQAMNFLLTVRLMMSWCCFPPPKKYVCALKHFEILCKTLYKWNKLLALLTCDNNATEQINLNDIYSQGWPKITI